jgi:K+-transporting ATPase ATPase C chain
MYRQWIGPIRFMFCLTMTIVLVYGLGISIFANTFFYRASRGSLVYQAHHVIASKLIAQQFTQDIYFWPRISVTNFQTDVLSSTLLIEKNRQYWQKKTVNYQMLPSASSVDPHIKLEDALQQIDRISSARGLAKTTLIKCVKKHTGHAFLGIFGQEHVNIMTLNLALDGKLGTCHD